MLRVDHGLFSYHVSMVSCHQSFVGGAGRPDRREPMGGSEESQDHHEAAEYGDAEGLGLPSLFLSSAAESKTSVTGSLQASSLLSCLSQNFIALL